jgi:hypothetical protein
MCTILVTPSERAVRVDHRRAVEAPARAVVLVQVQHGDKAERPSFLGDRLGGRTGDRLGESGGVLDPFVLREEPLEAQLRKDNDRGTRGCRPVHGLERRAEVVPVVGASGHLGKRDANGHGLSSIEGWEFIILP